MSDLKTPFNQPIMPTQADLGGDSITERGTDPNINVGGDSALQPVWPADKAIVPTPGGQETANSVSGLPSTPSRFEPSGTPPAPPTLQDRNPGTIDQR